MRHVGMFLRNMYYVRKFESKGQGYNKIIGTENNPSSRL